jgi:hypothetical protein
MLSLYIISLLFVFIVCTLRLNFYFGPSFIDRLLVTDSRILFILFFTVSLIFIYIFSSLAIYFSLDLSVLSTEDISCGLADKNNTEVKIGENTTVNINAANISVSVDTRVAAAISAGGGATAGIQVAKYVAGPPAVKIAAGVATAGVVQATTAIMSKVLSSNSNNTGGSKLVANLIPSSTGSDILNDYPLNLLTDMNSLLICALVFLYIILNIYITKYIISKDLVKYIPACIQNYKVGKLVIF